ncbi:exported hypothetical protein [Desulfamplus magnetovallimortis]|uniref:Uncharacterized protein n=1 Tax=Desulfamplus magnetovallimortis TaxID=1246637 RepID=A0A1W1H9N1_9BACT|nr:carboxypeptidase-like regulatory domain-containing protein [Desulfamplus magnetovallimortis]SLM29162.1 exported hypothetical protein [Desulfamplus magnetovallimortis]
MSRIVSFVVIIFLAALHGIALGESVLYDDFSGATLDEEKWYFSSNNQEPVIKDGVLELAVSGSDTKLSNTLGFLQAQNIIAVQTRVKISSDSYASSGARGKFRIGSFFYNDSHGPGSGQSHNRLEGDVWAEFRLELNDTHSLKAIADITRVDDADDTVETILFCQEFTTVINFDTEYSMSMEFKDGVFGFTLNDETWSYEVETPMYPPYDYGEPILTSRLYLDPGEDGLFKAILDDVMVEIDESDKTVIEGNIINAWVGSSSKNITRIYIDVYCTDISFNEGLESITIDFGGEQLPLGKDDFELSDYGKGHFEYYTDIPGSPEIGTYTFTVVSNGVTYTSTNTQSVNRELPVPDINSFRVDGQTFSWDLVNYEEESIPLYYRLRVYDSSGKRLINTDHNHDMSSYTYEGELTEGDVYLMYVRVSDSDDWIQVQNQTYNEMYFVFGESSGSISGTVFGDHDNDAATSDVPVEGMHVQVFSDACNWQQIGWVNTDINGSYIVSGLPVGEDVYVKTCTECNNTKISYINEYYNSNSNDCSEATPIRITDGDTPDINFYLEPGGIISGRIVDTSGNPLQTIDLGIFGDKCGGEWFGGARTNDQGYYEIVGVPDITVYLNTYCPEENPLDFVNKYYDGNGGTFDCSAATPLYVAPLETLAGIDMTLEPAGSVSGQIIDENGAPVPNFNIYAFDASCGGLYLSGTVTDEAGNFVIRSVPAGMDVFIWTGGYSDSSESPYIDKVWDGNNGSADCNEGVALDVTPHQETSGINMVLDFDSPSRNIILYDDFSSSSINAEKWKDFDESISYVENGKLILNATGSNEKISSRIYPTNQEHSYIETKIIVSGDSTVPLGTWGKFRIGAIYYNDSKGPGSGQDHNGYEGDVYAEHSLRIDEGGSYYILSYIVRINDADWNSETTLFSKRIDLSDVYDTEYIMGLGFKDGVFTFIVDNEIYYYNVSTPIYNPYSEMIQFASRIYLDEGESGSFISVMDDVYVSETTSGYDASGYWLFDVTGYSTEELKNPASDSVWNEETTWESNMQGRNLIKQDNSTFSLMNWFYGYVYDYSTYQHYDVTHDTNGSSELTLPEEHSQFGWIYDDFHTIWFDIDINSEELQGEFILTFWSILDGSTSGNILKDEANPTYAKGVFTGKKFHEPVVLSSSSEFTVSSDNSPVLIYGSSHDNSVTLESGVYAELINFPGENTITIESDSSLFSVSRSGAVVTFEGSDGTILKMPATTSIQKIAFNDGVAFNLVIINNEIKLGTQKIEKTPAPIEQEVCCGDLVAYSTCKTLEQSDSEQTPNNMECIDYTYNDNTLYLKHVNAAFNCCPEELSANITIDGSDINITENEIDGLCDCLCLYDMDYRINGLLPGEYNIHIKGSYEEMIETINLSEAVSNEFCVERNSYPWGG